MLKRASRFWDSDIVQFSFALLIGLAAFTLPVTSFPWLARLGGGITIAPVALPLLLLVCLFWFVPFILKGGEAPFEIKPFLAFLIVAIISWLLSNFLPIYPYKNHRLLSEITESAMSLFFAAACFMGVGAWASQSVSHFRVLIRWVNLGGAVMLLWGFAQAFIVFFRGGEFPRLFYQIQDVFSARQGTILFQDRITGMAYEPSWMAHMLVILYIPLWLSCSISGVSVFPKIGKLKVEPLLLAGGVFNLFMTFSRIGWISFLLILAFVGFQWTRLLAKNIDRRIKNPWSGWRQKVVRLVISLGLFSLLGGGLLLLAVFLVWVGSKLEPRLARILTYDFSRAYGLFYLTSLLFFAERAVYWVAGWEVFNQFPLFGVGIGNVGFFFPQTMPAFGYGLTEIRDLFFRLASLPNAKSLWVRIFAETGLIGAAFFVTWLYVLFRSASLTKRLGDPETKFAGWMTHLTIIALLSEGFSIDSFALPYIWFTLGLAGAASALTRQKLRGMGSL